MNADGQKGPTDDFEEKKKLQKLLHELIDKCMESKIDFGPKLSEYVKRGTYSVNGSTVYEDLIISIMNEIKPDRSDS